MDQRRVFDDEKNCHNFLNIIRYYRSTQSRLKYSKYRFLDENTRYGIDSKIDDSNYFRVSILAFILMPTHYHLVLRQREQGGISFFVSQIQNSFTRYFNFKNQRKGQIFLQTFRSKLIQSEAQLKHVTRYVHLNIFSGGNVTSLQSLEAFPYSSFPDYLSDRGKSITETEFILNIFSNNRARYRSFVLDNAEHQKMLEYCKYTIKW